MPTEARQPFLIELSFGIPVSEPVRFTLRSRLSQPALIAPSEDKLSATTGTIDRLSTT